jgi:acyl carrier protein
MGLDSVELLMEVEEHFEIEISDAEAESICTVSDLRDITCSKLVANGWRANPDLILREISQLIARNHAIPIGQITATSRIVEDLKID